MNADLVAISWRLAVGLLVVAAGRAVIPANAPAVAPPLIEISTAIDEAADHFKVEAREERASPPQLSFMLDVDGVTYAQITHISPQDRVAHDGKIALVADRDQFTAVARVSDRALPAQYRGWIRRRIIVDENCEANVTGFALIAKLDRFVERAHGKRDEDALPLKEGPGVANLVMKDGQVILAAELDGCEGTLARNATDTPIIVFREQHDETIEAPARRALIAARGSAKVLEEYGDRGDAPWDELTHINTGLIHHPITGATFVWANPDSDSCCDEPRLNLFGLWRVGPDGALDEVAMSNIGIESDLQLIDLEGDGKIELIGRPWRGADLLLEAADGNDLDVAKD